MSPITFRSAKRATENWGKKMKIIVLSRLRMAALGAGDWKQATSTVEYMRKKGLEVDHHLLTDHVSSKDENTFPEMKRVSSKGIAALDADVIHFIGAPEKPITYPKGFFDSKTRPLLAASTIFWDSLTTRQVVANNQGATQVSILKFLARYCMSVIPEFRAKRFRNYDLLLPNSELECQLCRRYFNLRKRTQLLPIPNGIDPIPEWASNLLPPAGLTANEYVIYPGHFSPRKNQLMFIRAIKESQYPVVFMGGAVGGNEYFSRCKREASQEHLFAGRVEHGSKLFYAYLSNARVACLASSCETPGIALLEAASLGVRPVVTNEGSAPEYLGFEAEYLTPTSAKEIVGALARGWRRGRLTNSAAEAMQNLTWSFTAQKTVEAYKYALSTRL